MVLICGKVCKKYKPVVVKILNLKPVIWHSTTNIILSHYKSHFIFHINCTIDNVLASQRSLFCTLNVIENTVANRHQIVSVSVNVCMKCVQCDNIWDIYIERWKADDFKIVLFAKGSIVVVAFKVLNLKRHFSKLS